MNWDRLPLIHRYSRFLQPESRASCDLTIAIKPEKWRETNWTKVSIDVSSDGASLIAGRSQGMPPDQY
jgi:hypothetical protein